MAYKKRKTSRLKQAMQRLRRLSRARKQYLRINVIGFLAVLALLGMGQMDWDTPTLSDETSPETEYSQVEFIETIGQIAQENYPNSHVLPSVVVAQAILESNYGQSTLSRESYNLFGRKAHPGEPAVTLSTKEVVDGEVITINAPFKVYANYTESIQDHGRLMNRGVDWNANLYAGVVGEPNYEKATQALQEAGYATDPSYAQKLDQLISKHQLTRFDF